MMLENAVYSVITVEGCAAILWKDGKSPEMREKAATALRITAPDLLELQGHRRDHPRAAGRRARRSRGDGDGAAATRCIRQLDELRTLQARQARAPAPARSSCAWEQFAGVDVTVAHLDRSRLQGQPKGVLPLGRSTIRRRSTRR